MNPVKDANTTSTVISVEMRQSFSKLRVNEKSTCGVKRAIGTVDNTLNAKKATKKEMKTRDAAAHKVYILLSLPQPAQPTSEQHHPSYVQHSIIQPPLLRHLHPSSHSTILHLLRNLHPLSRLLLPSLNMWLHLLRHLPLTRHNTKLHPLRHFHPLSQYQLPPTQ